MITSWFALSKIACAVGVQVYVQERLIATGFTHPHFLNLQHRIASEISKLIIELVYEGNLRKAWALMTGEY